MVYISTRPEFNVMYSMSDFAGKSQANIHQFFIPKRNERSIHCHMPHPDNTFIHCLCGEVILCAGAHTFHTYSRNMAGQARLSDLALIFIERELAVSTRSGLSDPVIDQPCSRMSNAAGNDWSNDRELSLQNSTGFPVFWKVISS